MLSFVPLCAVPHGVETGLEWPCLRGRGRYQPLRTDGEKPETSKISFNVDGTYPLAVALWQHLFNIHFTFSRISKGVCTHQSPKSSTSSSGERAPAAAAVLLLDAAAASHSAVPP